MNMKRERQDYIIDSLRQKVSRMEGQGLPSTSSRNLPFQVSLIDNHIPALGLQLGTLHEISGTSFLVDDAAAISFTAGIVARISGPILWCLKSADLFAPSLEAVGLIPDRVVYAEIRDEASRLAIMEDGLRQPGLAAVVGEITELTTIASRRLHLAARSSGVTAFVIHRSSQFKKQQSIEPTTAETRWRISSLPSTRLPVQGIGRSRWLIELTRCRDGEPAQWEMEACDASGYLSVPAELAHRPATQSETISVSA